MGLMEDILNPIIMGAKHSGAQIRDDFDTIMSGGFNKDIAGRLWDVIGELPIAKGLTKSADVAKGILGPIGRDVR